MDEYFFTIKTKNESAVNAVLQKQKSVEFDGLNVLADYLALGQIVFIVFGGDKPEWETGLVGLGTIAKLPYGYEGRNYKVAVDIKILFSKPIKRADLVLFPDTYDIIGIAPITKWEPNQALSQVETGKAYALLNAIFLIDDNAKREFNGIFSNEQISRIKGRFRRFIVDDPLLYTNKSLAVNTLREFCILKFTANPIFFPYICSLLAKSFAILTGNSGTGKTRIATRFAEYLEKKNDSGLKNHLLIPVGADWTDNTKILGFYNPLKKEYQSTPALDFILLAGQNPEIPFFLILDEMNLSHVERYFSDFLSAMESGEPIPLYKKDADCESSIPEEIVLPKNLFVTGTVNIDETTYMFSPKVLDRANVIEFKPEMDDVLGNLVAASESDSVKQADPGVAEGFIELANRIRKDSLPEELKSKFKEKTPVLESVYKILEVSGFEFAYRTAKEIRLYAFASYETCEDKSKFNINTVIDQQIVQKILPKIHGNKKQIGTMLTDLKNELSKYDEFKLSQIKVSSMLDKLEKYQYASFI